MSVPALKPAGARFLRPGGRQGHYRPHHDPDDFVRCPFEFTEVPGRLAEDAIADLRRAHPAKTPMLFGSPHEAGMLFERMRGRKRLAAEWLQDAETFDIDAWFAERVAYWMELQAQSGEVIPPRGKWPSQSKTYSRLTIPNELLRSGPKPTVIIGLLPTADPTETAAYLHFGGWNDCPRPPVHIVLAKQWREKYGAIQVTNTYETVEFQVARPVSTREEALSLALEQFHWCSDSVPDTLQAAAGELIGSTVWVFWWD